MARQFDLLEHDAALRAVAAAFEESFSKRVESRALSEAIGYILAEDILADRDLPPYNRAMMDGFAISSRDFSGVNSGSFKILGSHWAGSPPPDVAYEPGGCLRIMTGAAVPPEYDAVIKFEESSVAGESVSFSVSDVSPGLNIASQGEECRAGDLLVKPGTPLNTSILTVAATCGYSRLQVYAPPRVALVTTGSELVSINEKPEAHQIRNSNRFLLETLLGSYTDRVESSSCIDRPEVMRSAIAPLLDSDLLVVTGGVSMGDGDYVPDVLSELGVKKIFHGVRIRPGKPIWFGRSEKGLVFGLPGNPYSARVGFHVFIEPLLRLHLQSKNGEWRRYPLLGERSKKHNMTEYFRCRLVEADGALALEPIKAHGSGDVTSSIAASGIARHPGDSEKLAAGEPIDYLEW